MAAVPLPPPPPRHPRTPNFSSYANNRQQNVVFYFPGWKERPEKRQRVTGGASVRGPTEGICGGGGSSSALLFSGLKQRLCR